MRTPGGQGRCGGRLETACGLGGKSPRAPVLSAERRSRQQLLPFRPDVPTELLLFLSGNKCHGPGPAQLLPRPSNEKGAVLIVTFVVWREAPTTEFSG